MWQAAVNGELRVRLHPSQAGPAVHVAGHLDVSNVETLLRVVEVALRIRGARTVCIDLSQVVYLDVAGVAGLLECRRQAQRQGRAFIVTAISPQAAWVIGNCGAVVLLPVPQGLAGCATVRPRSRRRPGTRTFCALLPLLGSRRYI